MRSPRTALRVAPRAEGLPAIALGVVPLVAGTAVGVVTNARGLPWYRALAKPSWTPPDGVFGPVWTVLYLLMGRALVLVVAERRRSARGAAHDEDAALGAFWTQLALNLLWSVLFFGARRVRLAGAEIVLLWVSIVVTILAVARVRLVAALLLLPYLAWTSFAAVLNLAIARRNPGH